MPFKTTSAENSVL